ncbi:MAG: nucleotidyltransferase family protein [Gammaproteobacteria bacterium]|nr:nucleotidyltransferase family protein [Gammaproteobacteria bacterium]
MAFDASTQAKIFAVVLAAGESRRFGTTKQLATFRGEKFVHGAARIARDCCADNTVIVVGHKASEVCRATDRQCQFVLINDRYKGGLGSSIALAANALAHAADALLLILADQPLITTRHLRELIAAWSGADDNIVATQFDNVKGPPILMPTAAFSLLQTLSGDQGAKHLLENENFQLTTVRFDNARIDIDTPEDLERLNQVVD